MGTRVRHRQKARGSLLQAVHTRWQARVGRLRVNSTFLAWIFLVCLCRENQEKVLSCRTSPQTMQANPIFRFCCNWIGSVFLTSKRDSTILFTTPIGTVNLGEWILKMRWITISCNSQLLEDLTSILSALMVVHNYL